MAGPEFREFVGKLEMRVTRERERFNENDSMRDFWRTSDRESVREMARATSEPIRAQTIADLHRLEEHALRPYSFVEDVEELGTERAHMKGQSGIQGTHQHVFLEYQPPYLDTALSSQALGTLLPASAYTNFINATYARQEMKPNIMSLNNQLGAARAQGSSLPPVAPHGTSFPSVGGVLMETHTLNRDMETLRRELVFKCPRSSEILMALTHAAEGLVQRHQSRASWSGPSSDAPGGEEETPGQENSSEQGADKLRAAIIDHPFYPEMVLAHVRIFKIGAPKGLRAKLDELTRKFQRYQDAETSQLGDDPALDYFMRSYVDLLTKFREEIEEPFIKFMAFKDQTTKLLEDICGHYVETRPDEEDNYGFEIGSMDEVPDEEELDMVSEENVVDPSDIDDSIVIDPMAPDDEIKKVLYKKYGHHIGGLKAEFMRIRKKGKLPSNARSILKDWFNHHSFWPYPSEMEKAYLQRMCALNIKQINNWFINERKRHWSCEGKCMHPNAKMSNNNSGKR